VNHIYTNTDQELIQKIKQGDTIAFTHLYDRHWESLFNNAYKRVQQEPVSQDIVQDIFTDLWDRRASVEIGNVAAYLHTAVRFQVFKFFARNKITPHFIEPFENIADTSMEADGAIRIKELDHLLNAWMESLPKKRQHIYQLRTDEDLSTREIASRMRVSQKTVQNQLGTSMKSLRSKLSHFFTF
jgi:RNA polymerase sigma-70 factor (ECF subfamily)